MTAYYERDLAWIHHAGYSRHVEQTAPGIVSLLGEAGVPKGALVLDVGCGSGRLARKLLDAGFRVHGVDASPAMIDLARRHAAAASFEVLRLPCPLPAADAVVSTGHVLNYLDTPEEIARALAGLARALRPGGLLAIDWMTERFAAPRQGGEVHAKVEDDWAVVTRFSRPEPRRFDRRITVFRREGDCWRRSDEHHRNVTCEAAEALRVLRDNGVDAQARASFGAETLPEGLIVLCGARRRQARR